MKNIIKTGLIFSIIVMIFSLSISPVQAVDLTNKLKAVGSAGNLGETPDLASVIGRIIKAFLTLLGAVFMIYVIYGGYQWIMAKGNEEQLTKDKAIIRGSIIGIIVVLAAYAITSFVISNVSEATGYGQSINS